MTLVLGISESTMVISTKYILLLSVVVVLSSCNVLNEQLSAKIKKFGSYSQIITCHDCKTLQLTVLKGPFIIYFPCKGTTPYCDKLDPPINSFNVVGFFAQCVSYVPPRCTKASLPGSALQSSSDDLTSAADKTPLKPE